MTVLALNRLWVNLLATGEGLSGASNTGKQQEFTTEGSVVRLAGGRLRSISVVGEAASLPFSFVLTDLPTVSKLRSWAAQAVEVRDSRGQKWYGTFFSLSVSEYKRPDLYAVSFTLETTTYAEGA